MLDRQGRIRFIKTICEEPKAQGHGRGLGLATAYGIVQQHGGLLHVSSEPAAGATFEVYLPASGRWPGRRAGARGVAQGGAETILVAEDDNMVRGVAIELLEEAGYTAIAARNGVEAVDAYRNYETSVDLLLLDIVMPRKSAPRPWRRSASSTRRCARSSAAATAATRRRANNAAPCCASPTTHKRSWRAREESSRDNYLAFLTISRRSLARLAWGPLGSSLR